MRHSFWALRITGFFLTFTSRRSVHGPGSEPLTLCHLTFEARVTPQRDEYYALPPSKTVNDLPLCPGRHTRLVGDNVQRKVGGRGEYRRHRGIFGTLPRTPDNVKPGTTSSHTPSRSPTTTLQYPETFSNEKDPSVGRVRDTTPSRTSRPPDPGGRVRQGRPSVLCRGRGGTPSAGR